MLQWGNIYIKNYLNTQTRYVRLWIEILVNWTLSWPSLNRNFTLVLYYHQLYTFSAKWLFKKNSNVLFSSNSNVWEIHKFQFHKFQENLQSQLKFNTISLVQREKGKIFLLIEILKAQSLIIKSIWEHFDCKFINR